MTEARGVKSTKGNYYIFTYMILIQNTFLFNIFVLIFCRLCVEGTLGMVTFYRHSNYFAHSSDPYFTFVRVKLLKAY